MKAVAGDGTPVAARYARIYAAFVRNCLVRELEFRANFAFSVAASVGWAVLTMVLAGLVFGNVRAVAGWDLDRMFILTGTFVIIDHIVATLFDRNMSRLSELVNRGELDFVLTKPISSQFLVSARYFDFRSAPGTVVGIAYVLIGLRRLELSPGPLDVALYLLMLVCAVLSVYAVWFIVVTLVLWTGRINNISHLINPFVDLARVPTDIFQGPLRLLVTFAVPIALISTIPSKALLGVLDPGMAPYQVGLTVALLWVSHWFWGLSLRRYSSASS